MKRTISVICAAALVMFAACQKEGTTASKVALTATLEQQVDNGATKTALNPTNNVIWSAGDQIKVHTTVGLETLTLTEGHGTTLGKFGYTTGDDPNYAIYPASACTSLDGSIFTFTLPATQTYAENSFGPGANVAVAAISGGNMAFKNVCGVLKLQLKGNMKVSKIELTGKSGEKLSGAFTVDVNASPFVGAVKDGEPTDGEKKVTLDCSHFGETSKGAAVGGVQLDFETATIFDIIVPVSAFASGFEAKITDALGDTFFATLETTGNNNIARSTITRMPTKGVSLLPNNFEELAYLEGTGTQYCEIGVDISNDLIISSKIQFTVLPTSANGNGALGAGGYRLYYFGGTPQYFEFALGSKVVPTNIKCDLEPHVTILNTETGEYRVDESAFGQITEFGGTYSGTTPILLFKRNGFNCLSQKVFWVKVWKNNAFVSYLIPANNKENGDKGMYNVVDGTLYTSLSETNFVGGPALSY